MTSSSHSFQGRRQPPSRKRTVALRDNCHRGRVQQEKKEEQSSCPSSLSFSKFLLSIIFLLSSSNNGVDAFQGHHNNRLMHRTSLSYQQEPLFSSRAGGNEETSQWEGRTTVSNDNDNERRGANRYWNPLQSTSRSARISNLRNNSRRGASRNKQKMKPMPVTGYDAKAIEEYYDMRPLQVGWRLNTLGFPLLFWYARLLIDNANGVSDLPSVQRQRGKELRKAFVQSRSVTLIKSGQALSLRPDLIKNKIWAEELGKLVDAVGSFSDSEAMGIIKSELRDVAQRMDSSRIQWKGSFRKRKKQAKSKLQKIVANDPVLSLFEFENDFRAVASASIGQVYKAKIRKGPQLEAALGAENAKKWGGKVVAIKVQRPDVASSVSLDMYLLRRTATWLSKVRSGDILGIADQFGIQLFGELDYEREADNCLRFRDLYGKDWDNVMVPDVCTALTRKRVLVMEWVDGEKGPWDGHEGLQMVQLGLKCSVDQLMTTGLFHADPHRGNLLKTRNGQLAFLDFGMMADIDEEDRYGLFGLCIGLQSKDLPLVTENLLKVSKCKCFEIFRNFLLRNVLKNIACTNGLFILFSLLCLAWFH